MVRPGSISIALLAATLALAALSASAHPHDEPLDQARTCTVCQLAHQPGALPVAGTPDTGGPIITPLALPAAANLPAPADRFSGVDSRAPPA